MLPGTQGGFILGLVMGAVGVAILVHSIIKAVRGGFGDRMQAFYMMGASLYPVGVGCKFAILGPEFMRFHLSDIGFPLMLGYSLFLHRKRGVTKVVGSKKFYSLGETLVVLRHRKNSLLIALGLSYAYETIVGLMYWSRKDLSVQLIGTFDPLDMVMYTVGAMLGLGLLAFWRREVLFAVAANIAAIEAQRQANPPATPRRTNPPRRQSRSQRRRGKK